MEKKKFKIAIIGCGARSVPYAMTLANHEEVELVACADPDINHLRTMLSFTSVKEEDIRIYSDWKDLCDNEKELVGAVIATPNYLHHQPAAEIMKRGIPLALEKPLTNSMKDSEFLLDVVREHRPQLLIGFVLRSTPFYRKIREVLDSGRIGSVISIQADELVTPGVSSVISRSPWRRHAALSGGTMMEKCSHDMDLINWFSSSRPVSVNSYGGNLLFRPNPLFPKYCRNCPQEKCKYQSKPEFSLAAQDSVLHDFMQHTIAEQNCIYNVEKDIADNQSVQIEYANGMLANFMLAFNCSGRRAARNLHIVGTKGRIFGNVEENKLYVHTNEDNRETCWDIKVSGGHSGGNSGHAFELVKMMRDPSYKPDQDAYAGYLSNAICIAADISRKEGRRVNFRYDKNDFIEFV